MQINSAQLLTEAKGTEEYFLSGLNMLHERVGGIPIYQATPSPGSRPGPKSHTSELRVLAVSSMDLLDKDILANESRPIVLWRGFHCTYPGRDTLELGDSLQNSK